MRKVGCSLIRLLLLLLLIKSPSVVADDWVYTVRQGDTLWDICHEYTTRLNCWQLIGPHNDVDFPPNLLPGTRIRIPSSWMRQQPQAVKVTFIKGTAQKVTDDGHSSALTLADELSLGMRLIVNDNSLVSLRFADGSTMLVESLSELRFDRLSRYGKTGMADTRIHLLRGAVQNKVPKKRGRLHFEVSTPSAVAAVRGTDFRVVSDLTKNTQTMRSAVYEGLIAISNHKDEKALPEAFGLVAQQGQQLPEKVKLLRPPTLKFNKTGYQRMPFKLKWNSLRGARTYKTQLLDPDNTSIVLFSQVTDKHHSLIEGVDSGCYLLHVSGVDNMLLQGVPAKHTLCLAKPLDKPSLMREALAHNHGELSWASVPGAIKYRIDIASSPSFSGVRSQWSKSNSIAIKAKHHSDRYIRIVAVDRHGFAGEPSETLVIDKKPTGLAGLYAFLTVVAAILLL